MHALPLPIPSFVQRSPSESCHLLPGGTLRTSQTSKRHPFQGQGTITPRCSSRRLIPATRRSRGSVPRSMQGGKVSLPAGVPGLRAVTDMTAPNAIDGLPV